MTKPVSTAGIARNLDFTLHIGDNNTWSHEQIQIALLADIRAELRELNRTLGCYRVRQMCDDIHRIDTRLRLKGLLANKRKAKKVKP